MIEPVVTRHKPYLVELKAGRRYAWCACGRSRQQPFCDGSHAGSGFEPKSFVAETDQEVLLCGCKRTGQAPFCDGSHNSFARSHEVAATESIAAAAGPPITPRSPEMLATSKLDGDCFVVSVDDAAIPEVSGGRLGPVVGLSRGARFLSQWCMSVAPGLTDVFRFEDRDALLFFPFDAAVVTVSGRDFAVGRECGLHVRNGESFRIHNPLDHSLRVLLTVCPGCEKVQRLDCMPDDFQLAHPYRVRCSDPGRREPLADRFYQVLHGPETGCNEITQFIGEIPQSRAAMHRHLYEEIIVVLEGCGYLWTESSRAAVSPGDIMFLPCKQLHALECTTGSGMRLMGAFYPAGSPAVNY